MGDLPRWEVHLRCFPLPYSTVTLLARLRGWSTFWPSSTATWYANSCSITSQDRRRGLLDLRHLEHVRGHALKRSVALRDEREHRRIARHDLVDVLTILSLVELVVQDGDHWELVVEQRDGPCLSSPPVVPSAWMYEISLSLSAPSRPTG